MSCDQPPDHGHPPLYPIFLDLRGRRVVMVGAGPVAARKIEALRAAGARVTLIAPRATAELAALAAADELAWERRPYRRGDLAGAALALVAVDDPRVSEAAAAEARRAGIPVNVADRPELGDALVPAVVRRGRLQLAVSTGGASPAWARRLRQELEARFGAEYERLFDALAAARQELRAVGSDPAERRRALRALADPALLPLAAELEGPALVAAVLARARAPRTPP